MRVRLWLTLLRHLAIVAGTAVGMLLLSENVGYRFPLASLVGTIVLCAVIIANFYAARYVIVLLATPCQDSAINWQRLHSCLEPFALYLRNYSLERGYRFAFPQRLGSLAGLGSHPFPDVDNTLEASLVNGLAIPAFTLVNRSDLSVGAALRVAVDAKAWRFQVEAIAKRAVLVIVSIENLTNAVRDELVLLEGIGAGSRTVIVASAAMHEEIERLFPALHRISYTSILDSSDRKAVGSLPLAVIARWGTRAWGNKSRLDQRIGGTLIWAKPHALLKVAPAGSRLFRACDFGQTAGVDASILRNPMMSARGFLEDELYWYSALLLEAAGVHIKTPQQDEARDLFVAVRKAAHEATIHLEPVESWSEPASGAFAVQMELNLAAWLAILLQREEFWPVGPRLADLSAEVFDDAMIRSRWRTLQCEST